MASLSDNSLLLEFVAESKEHLADIEPHLLTLEQQGANTDPDIVNAVFRAIHSIKGASGFFGLTTLKNLSHIMESVLMLIRDGKLVPNAEIMDPLLVGVDRLNQMLGDIYASELVACQDVIDRLEVILGKPDGVQEQDSLNNTAPTRTVGNFELGSKNILLESAIQNGQRFFELHASLDSDLAEKNRTPLDLVDILVSVGLIIDTTMDITEFPDLEQCLKGSLTLSVLCATVLEADLLAMALDLPEDQVSEVSVDVLKAAADLTTKPSSDVSGTKSLPKPEANALETEAIPPTEHQEVAVALPEPPVPNAKVAPNTEAKAKPAQHSGETETIRVRIDLLNKLMDLAGEMVLSRNQLLRILDNQTEKNGHLVTIAQSIDLITSELQEHIMHTRMQSVGSIFGKFPRVVRDMARQLNKQIELQTSGEDVELDKSILESLSDPLTHLIRNCCDHAIELPEEREKAGKPATGTISLKAFHEGGQIHISITDDGRGIDHTRIAKKAMDHGLLTEQEIKRMSPQEMVNLIFLPGLSTAEKISDISGRGVGMDVVKTNIEKVGGHISIETELGKGTTILLRLPLTLAIIPSLIVGASKQRFAVPQVNLVELVCVKASEIATRIEKVGSASVLRLRGKLLPLLRLADVLNIERTFVDRITGQNIADRRQSIIDPRVEENLDSVEPLPNERQHWSSDYNILVLKVGTHQFGLIVDELFDMEEIVVKPLSHFIKNCRCFAGATIMGDGSVAMILDAGGILADAKLSFTELQAEESRQRQLTEANQANSFKQAILLFKNAPDEIFAVPLSSVLRLEKLSSEQVEHLGGREFLTYQDKSIELLRLERKLPVKPSLATQKDWFLILPRAGNGRVGILASEIVDTVEMQLHLEHSVINQPGITGSVVIRNHLTVLIDPDAFLGLHREVRGLAHAS